MIKAALRGVASLPHQGLTQPLYPNGGRGLCGPCTPQQGYHPCTRCATYNRIEQGCFRMKVEETKNSTTGIMKTKKERLRE